MELIGCGRQAEVYADGDNECIKLLYENASLYDIERETRIMQYISTLPIPAPRFLGTVEYNGRHGIRMERVKGRSILAEMLEHPERVEEYGVTMGRLQRDYHSIKASGLDSMVSSMTWAINRAEQFSDEEKRLLILKLESMPSGYRLIHTDYHADNILVTENGVYIIDWTGAVYGNPLGDVARTALTCSVGTYPIGADQTLCDLIDSCRRILKAAYLKGYGIDEKELHDWLPLVAASRFHCAPKEETETNLPIVKRYLRELGK